ncbi:MAG: 5'-methylthioadenosine/S-adenosylhomocysteine nucleosidase [Bacteroidales bacterium]|nr:5'-methylthioadenosine/S-adenosylhomocysteine nucleosidase [Candidatus Cacconaster scatequi]
MKKIGIVCAMKKEFDLLLREFPEGDIHCILSGIGKVNAAAAAERLVCEHKPDCILSIGCAGTFVEDLEECETVIVNRCAYHDVFCGKEYAGGQMAGLPLYFESAPALVKAARKALPQARTGLLCTGDQFYVSREEDERQKRWFPDALAIDMEGTAVAQVAFLHNIPFLAVKIISDNHTQGEQMEHYDGFWSNMADRSFTTVKAILNSILEDEKVG